ncbi:hypothetical protein DICVIV_10296 [Dictyocaulus viviparus]|uniref:Uncharacterized protein n=1 Tax=Dictyocaulus viviparus TaxID=29172 RepID=A0A0D8XIX1_DICVI|nr:hypothetical protein DICVIV_10296 [Dictyocaulus viviparus]
MLSVSDRTRSNPYGGYDVNVMMFALTHRRYECIVYIDRRRYGIF